MTAHDTLCEYCTAPTDLRLCADDARTLRAALTRVPWYLEQLEHAATGQADLSATILPGDMPVEESPVPFNAAATRATRDLRAILTAMCGELDHVHHVRWNPHYLVGLTTAPAGFIGPLAEGTVRSHLHGRPPSGADMAGFLAYHLHRLVDTKGVGKFYADIDKATRLATNVINRPIPPAYRGPCPTVTGHDDDEPIECGVPLYSRRGAETVKCVRCGNTYMTADIEEYLLDTVDYYRWTATEILRLMRELNEPVSRKRFYQWRREGRLAVAGYLHDRRIVDVPVDDKDNPVFRLGDVRDLRNADQKPARKDVAS